MLGCEAHVRFAARVRLQQRCELAIVLRRDHLSGSQLICRGEAEGFSSMAVELADAPFSSSPSPSATPVTMMAAKTTRTAAPAPIRRQGRGLFGRRKLRVVRSLPGSCSTSSQPSFCIFEMTKPSVPRTVCTTLYSYLISLAMRLPPL